MAGPHLSLQPQLLGVFPLERGRGSLGLVSPLEPSTAPALAGAPGCAGRDGPRSKAGIIPPVVQDAALVLHPTPLPLGQGRGQRGLRLRRGLLSGRAGPWPARGPFTWSSVHFSAAENPQLMGGRVRGQGCWQNSQVPTSSCPGRCRGHLQGPQH